MVVVVVVVTSTVGRDDNTAPPYTGTAFDTRARTRRGRVSCAPTPAPRHTAQAAVPDTPNRGVRRRARAASQFAMPKPTTAGMPTSLSQNHLADGSLSSAHPSRPVAAPRATACSLYGACRCTGAAAGRRGASRRSTPAARRAGNGIRFGGDEPRGAPLTAS